jgi:molybdopterin molybdotransferase
MRDAQPGEMISVEEALECMMPHFHALEPEEVAVLDALGRVLAEDIYSDIDVPPFQKSAMDGYAVRAADLASASDQHAVVLEVIGHLAAGRVSDKVVEPGTTVRIMTGAPLPAGSDAVVRFEDTDDASARPGHATNRGERNQVQVFASVGPNDNVRAAGEDFRRGELGLSRGTVIRPAEIGVLATLGRPLVRVIRRPRVGILVSGDELVAIDESLPPGKIRSSNEYGIAALILTYGGLPVRLGIARDNLRDLVGKIRVGVGDGVDLFITSGGVSVGDYDLVKTALNLEGQMYFWRVRMSPGKSIAFGTVGGVPLLGLPGTPSAAMVAFEQFARPAILTMLGKTRCVKPTVEAVLEQDVRSRGLRGFVQVALKKTFWGWSARPTVGPGVGVLTSMVMAHGLAVIPDAVREVKAGERVHVQVLDWPEQE